MTCYLQIQAHIALANQLLSMVDEINALGRVLVSCVQSGHKVLLFGNGGSAADAQHIAAELVVRFRSNRRALPAIALTTDSSVLTACGNDFGFDSLFSRQVEAFAQIGDVVIGISTSGKSSNVIEGLQAAKRQGATTILLTGLIDLSEFKQADYVFSVPSRETARIQEMHILVGHLWCEQVEEEMLVVDE